MIVFYFVNNHDGSDLPIGRNIIVTIIGINYDLAFHQNKIDIYFIAPFHLGHPSALIMWLIIKIVKLVIFSFHNFCSTMYESPKVGRKGGNKEYIPFCVQSM